MADDKDMVLSEKQYQSLYSDLDMLINQGRARAQSAMNRELMLTYWNCGKRLDDEKLTENGGYGTSIMERLARDLATDRSTLVRCQWFYRYYPGGAPTGTGLVWSMYRELITLKDEKTRRFYEKESEAKHWCHRSLNNHPLWSLKNHPPPLGGKDGKHGDKLIPGNIQGGSDDQQGQMGSDLLS